MKKLLITLTATLVCVGAFGQGKLMFGIDYEHLIYFTTDRWELAPVDAAATANGTGTVFPIAGSGLYTGPGSTIAALSGSPTFIASLFAGTSSDLLTLQTTTTIGDVSLEGSVVPVNCTFPALPAGTPAFFQVQVCDSRASSAVCAWASGMYAGVSQIFQATPAAGAAAPIWVTNSPVNSTWAPGTSPVIDMVQYGPGFYGAIEVFAGLGDPPYINSQPHSTTNYWGQSVGFSVGAWGWPAPSYQWTAHGTNLTDGPHVSGSATPSLTLRAITSADAGNYQVFVSNCAGTAASHPATLTVVLIRPAISSVLPQPDGGVALSFTGTPYSTNRLWATTSLTPPVVWFPVSTNVASPAGTWQVTDTGAIGSTNCFYRTSMP